MGAPTGVPFRADTVHGVLEAAVAATPDAPAVSFVDGASYTRAALLREVRLVAGGMARAGIGPGDRVAIVVSNRPEFLTSYLAVSTLGAVSVPLNTALRGDVLTTMLASLAPYSLVVGYEFADDVLASVHASGGAERVWTVGDGDLGGAAAGPGFQDLRDGPPLESAHPRAHSDLCSILFTSGTTGRSKGVMWSHRMATACAENATWVMGYTSDDVVHTCLPLYHINALFTAFLAALQQGARVVVSHRFSASRYWRELRECGATTTNMLGSMAAIVTKQDPLPAEREHALRLIMVVPFPTDRDAFERRFGCRATELYGSTDSGIPLGVPHGERPGPTCGRAAPGWEVAIVDERDRPVARGERGELVTRPAEPFVGQLGYWREPEKTWAAHRNLWFHTGDAFVQDDDGWFHFADRLTDAMRVSGENVSAFEVEQVVLGHPGVAEVAVYAVPSELGEDDIVAAVVAEAGAAVTEPELVEFAAERLAYFSVPRYVVLLDELPKTSTQKVQKGVLRERVPVSRAWDGGRRRRGAAPGRGNPGR